MKKLIKKAEYEKLSDDLKKLYVANDNGEEYKLDLEDDEDVTGLKNALKSEKEEKRKLKEELRVKQEKEDAENDKLAKEKGDFEAVEQSYKDKIAKMKAEHKEAIAKLTSNFSEHFRSSKINELAMELFHPNKQRLGRLAIKDRISVDVTEDSVEFRILDSEGKLSATTIDEFKKELSTDKELSGILKVAVASGGGPRSDAPGERSPKSPQIPTSLSTAGGPVLLKDRPLSERMEYYESIPDSAIPEPGASRS